jgi:hypothetical protein
MFLQFLDKLKSESNQRLIESVKNGYLTILEGEYFDNKLSEDDKKHTATYVGRGVTWFGHPGSMVVIHKDYVDGMFGNIYDSDKLSSLTDMIKYSEDNIELECSYGYGTIVDLDDIKEHQEAVRSDRFNSDYDGIKEPLSLGDDDLDMYITDGGIEELLYISSIYSDEMYELFEKYKGNTRGQSDDALIKSLFEELLGVISDLDLEDDEAEIDELKEEFVDAFTEWWEYESELIQAISENRGDLGDFRIQLRDGHHRVNAAINAGENYVCVNLVEDDGSDPMRHIGNYSYVNEVNTMYSP